jgi:hypothetical protein
VTGALVASLATGVGRRGRTPPFAFALRAGAASFLPLLGVGVLGGAIELFAAGGALAVASAMNDALEPHVGDARAFVFGAGALAALLTVALAVGVVVDLARVLVARRAAARLVAPADTPPIRIRDAAAGALRAARGNVARAFGAWAWRAALALALVYAGARAGDAVGGRGGGALWLLFALHQALTFARAGLRASWLARALRFTAEATT